MLNRKHLLAVAVALAASGMSAQARINAAQAADAAKAHIAGKVVDVDYRKKRGQYEVDIVAVDGRRYEVKVDARNGRVLGSQLDDDDDDHKKKSAKARKDDNRKKASSKARKQDDDDDDDDDDDRKKKSAKARKDDNRKKASSKARKQDDDDDDDDD